MKKLSVFASPDRPVTLPRVVKNSNALNYRGWMYWNASRTAIASYRRGSPDGTVVLSLRDIHLCPPSHRLKCSAGGTLVTIRAEHLADGWGASA